MKRIPVIAAIALTLCSCAHHEKVPAAVIIVADTPNITKETVSYQPIKDVNYNYDSLMVIISNMRRKADSLATKLFLSNFKVEKVRYYLNICLRNPSQDKYLKGWVRRAIE